MKVQILVNTFEPNRKSKTPTILNVGEIHELSAADAKELIDAGKAAEFKPEKSEEAKTAKPKKKSDEE